MFEMRVQAKALDIEWHAMLRLHTLLHGTWRYAHGDFDHVGDEGAGKDAGHEPQEEVVHLPPAGPPYEVPGNEEDGGPTGGQHRYRPGGHRVPGVQGVVVPPGFLKPQSLSEQTQLLKGAAERRQRSPAFGMQAACAASVCCGCARVGH